MLRRGYSSCIGKDIDISNLSSTFDEKPSYRVLSALDSQTPLQGRLIIKIGSTVISQVTLVIFRIGMSFRDPVVLIWLLLLAHL